MLGGKDEGEMGASGNHDPNGESEQKQPRHLLPDEQKVSKHQSVVDDYQRKDDLQQKVNKVINDPLYTSTRQVSLVVCVPLSVATVLKLHVGDGA